MELDPNKIIESYSRKLAEANHQILVLEVFVNSLQAELQRLKDEKGVN